jgi:hypothetical protein
MRMPAAAEGLAGDVHGWELSTERSATGDHVAACRKTCALMAKIYCVATMFQRPQCIVGSNGVCIYIYIYIYI